MHDLLKSEYAIPIVAIVSGCSVGICATISASWRRIRQAEINAALQHKMLEQGMSADDIKKVLEAGSQETSGSKPMRHC
jgi:hypothetical protein